MAISPETIDQVRLATDIVELVREYIPTLKRSGRNWKANCPFHNEKTPSFMVNAEKGIFHCFGCHAGGDAFTFVMKMDNLAWHEAVRKLAGRVGVVIRETKEEVIKRSEKQKIYDLLAQAAQFYHRILTETPEGKQAKSYLKKRGVDDAAIEKFKLGFAPSGLLAASASKKGFSREELSAAGLLTKTERGSYYEYMSDRVVFPIFDVQGRIVAFGGRTLKDEQPKYLNTPETSVYSKSQHLYGLFQAAPALRQGREILVLEGYMDVVMAHQFGVTSAVATLGTAFTLQQSQIVGRYADSVILLFDSDAAGNNAARRALETLLETDLSLKVAQLPGGVDPDEYLLQEGLDSFTALLGKESRSAVEFLAEESVKKHGSGNPDAKARVVAEVLPFLSKVKNAVLRREWIKHLADRLQTTEEAVAAEFKRHAGARGGRSDDGKSDKPSGGVVFRSVEEEILQLVAAYPQCRAMVTEDVFNEGRNRKVFALIAGNMPFPTWSTTWKGPMPNGSPSLCWKTGVTRRRSRCLQHF
ncbi:MAG: DNA primase [Endomicrobiales bacterium]